MADIDSDRNGSATEAPTPRRREHAREQGSFVHSSDLATAIQVLTGLGVLTFVGAEIARAFGESFREFSHRGGRGQWSIADARDLSQSLAERVVTTSAWPLVFILATGLLVAFGQMGWIMTWQAPRLRWERLNLASNFRRGLSVESFSRLGWMGVRIIALLTIVVVVLWTSRQTISNAGAGPTRQLIATSWDRVMHVGLVMSTLLLVFGCADYGFRWHRHEQSLKMTKAELKQEAREDQGDPLLKAALRKRLREQLKQRSIADVPKATVVITNPSHYAIAIQYVWGVSRAPKVLAKGTDELAARIREAASKFHIPVVENKPLARSLYQHVEIGQEIPEEFYRAIAEILAMLHRAQAA